jgi:hypothetical protein
LNLENHVFLCDLTSLTPTPMYRLLRNLQSKSPKHDEKSKHKSRTAQNDNSLLSKLPYEVIENILVYAWHGDPTGLPGGGSYIFDDPRTQSEAETTSLDGEDEPTTGTGSGSGSGLVPDPDLPRQGVGIHALPALPPAPHTRLTNAAWAATNGTGVFLGAETYLSLAGVCVMWREMMLDITRTYVSLPSLKKFHEYARVLEIDAPKDGALSRLKDSQDKADRAREGGGHGTGVEGAVALSKGAEKARRLCRSLHIDIPTGNLTMVPSWHDIPAILAPLTSLTYLILTAAEPHPALLALLTALPATLVTLDIHISSPFAYKPLVVLGGAGGPMNTSATIAQTQAEMARRETGRRSMESLREGVRNIKHVLINVIDPVLLGSLLEGFGSMETSTTDDRSSTTVYASPALQTVTLQGMRDLTSPEITRTISHSSTIHTLRLYPHANRLPSPKHEALDGLKGWNAVRALENEAWFPALEKLVVQLPSGYLKQSPQLERIRAACSKRGVLVDVERLS